VVLIGDGRAELDARLAELAAIDPLWAVCGNAAERLTERSSCASRIRAGRTDARAFHLRHKSRGKADATYRTIRHDVMRMRRRQYRPRLIASNDPYSAIFT
jgi:hypothetical protein